MKNKSLVIVQFKQCEPLLYEFKSIDLITRQKIEEYLISKSGFKSDEDSFIIVEEILKVKL